MIQFNKPYLAGNEVKYILNAVSLGTISGNGDYTKKCQHFFEKRYNFKKCLLTTSCTDALEMAAILCDVQPGDEVIVPSYTFVSSALAFVRQGAKIVFVDSMSDHPNLDVDKIEALITTRTKVIVPVHYGGVACYMPRIMELADKYGLFVVEDAAQAIEACYVNSKDEGQIDIPLGSIGHLAAFSFHETKNIISGEGGMLVINDDRFLNRAEIIWEKGTNRAEFYRGEVNKYGWVDVGSSFLPSELIAAFLWAQLESIDDIQKKRIKIWEHYFNGLKHLADSGHFAIPQIFSYATNNAHVFYLICNSYKDRTNLIDYLKSNDIMAVSHYQSLHKSEYYKSKHDGRELPNSEKLNDCLLRLPLFYELENQDVIINDINNFYLLKQ